MNYSDVELEEYDLMFNKKPSIEYSFIKRYLFRPNIVKEWTQWWR